MSENSTTVIEAMLQAGLEAVCDKWRYQDAARRFYQRQHRDDYAIFLDAALKHLCEHPVEITEDQLDELFDWAEKNGAYGSNRRSHYIGIGIFHEWLRRIFKKQT